MSKSNKALGFLVLVVTALCVGLVVVRGAEAMSWYLEPAEEVVEPTVEEIVEPATEEIVEEPAEEPAPETPAPEVSRPTTTPSTPTISQQQEIPWTISDYQRYYAGVCPSEQDKNDPFWKDWSYGAAIRFRDYPSRSAEYFIASTWESYMRSPLEQARPTAAVLVIGGNSNMGFDSRGITHGVLYTVRWSDMSIFWTFDFAPDPTSEKYQLYYSALTPEQLDYINGLEVEYTNFLRKIDSEYHTRCPND